MNGRTIRKYLFLPLVAIAALSMTGCTKGEYTAPGGTVNESGFRLSVVTKNMSREEVVTRASDPKTEAEREIKELHVFLFGPDGKYLQARQDGGGHSYQGYQSVKGTSTLRIDNEGFADNAYASRATVYVVANVEPGTFGNLTEEGYPERIPDETAFEAFHYEPISYKTLLERPASGMPMVGKSNKTVDLTQAKGEVVIEMKALMARIDFSFKVSSSSGEIGKLPSLNLTDYKVSNMATSVPLIAPDSESSLDRDGDGIAEKVTEREGVMDPTSGIIYNQSGEATLSFYVFENLRKPGYEGAYPYPDSIASDAYQCYKPLLAVRKDGDTIPATRLVIGGIYTDADDLTYTATCTIYLGSDPVSDFNVRRNHQYRNRVTISGITRTDDHSGNSVTFDARINVETTNPYYISLLRHKNLDAHFNITPMDIYLYDTERNPSMDIEVKDPEKNDWVRIERVPASVMASGNAEDYQISHPGQAYAAGTGKRRFFTTDLLTDPDQLADNTRYDDVLDRDRIYIYADENISTKSRKADLVLTYKENGQPVGEPHTVTLEQHGLLKVSVENAGIHQYYIYAEAYEEYLDYYDPLSSWTTDQVYDGLSWGPSDMGNINTGLGGFLPRRDAIEGFFNGRKNTIAILMEQGIYGQNDGFLGDGSPTQPLQAMVLDVKPSTAAEYCYRKNKTDGDGMISYDNMRWYLPTIRELENTLTTYYASTPEFQNSFYWSCNPAQRPFQLGDISIMEATSYARATMAHQVDGRIVHKPSGTDQYYDPDLGPASPYGKALRTTVLRIRAVYRPADDAEID